MFTIKYGIHRYTLTSRDTGEPRQFNTKDEAMAWYRDEKQWLKSIGYVFWFCHLIGPNGQQETIEQNS